ncbi:ATP-binding cassette domain-containing protein [Sphaerochaeta sp.]|jgi:iron complex transport system ATP-binding protein|uniref:Putative ABC transporter ATP-binding protein YlmA n=1 Tax=bioreactor metagenome TaxID=1076179 RepID=A0A644XM85_9ZZZZ|nr:ATP-binding cassette domain-containing protein [Sphaerochaeta sp.]MDD3456653.1 ATP-binding cassette domain-containing protein [Sphaerochaeta sp.]
MDECIMQLEHATVRRSGVPILDDISFQVKRNEHVAIIGPNGAGKSTLVQLLSEEIHPLYSPRTKRILFGKAKWEVLSLRAHLGIVSQSLQYLCNSSYKGWEIVISGFFSSIGLDFHHHCNEQQMQKMEETMHRYDAWHLRDKQMNRMSSGEARRILLARANVHDPQVMLLDEAVSNLDFPSRSQYRSTLEQLDREGKTIILATHELSEIIPAINRIVVMQHGRIVADGPKREILNEQLLSEVYQTKVFIDEREGLFSAWC